jgi:hypothetical protein
MMNETIMKFADDGRTERRINNGDGTGHLYVWDAAGNLITDQALTGLDIPPYEPLDSTGALATLLVVEGVVTLTDASNAIHEEEAHLVAEAEAWSLGGG